MAFILVRQISPTTSVLLHLKVEILKENGKMKNKDEELEEEWVVCLSKDCPDWDPVNKHLHTKTDCEKHGWEYQK